MNKLDIVIHGPIFIQTSRAKYNEEKDISNHSNFRITNINC